MRRSGPVVSVVIFGSVWVGAACYAGAEPEELEISFEGEQQAVCAKETLTVKLSTKVTFTKSGDAPIVEGPFGGCSVSPDGKLLMNTKWFDETAAKLHKLSSGTPHKDWETIWGSRFKGLSPAKVQDTLAQCVYVFLHRLSLGNTLKGVELPDDLSKRFAALMGVIAYGDTKVGLGEVYRCTESLPELTRRKVRQTFFNYAITALFLKRDNIPDLIRFDKFFRNERGIPDRNLHGSAAEFLSLLKQEEADRLAVYCLGFWLDEKLYKLSPNEKTLPFDETAKKPRTKSKR